MSFCFGSCHMGDDDARDPEHRQEQGGRDDPALPCRFGPSSRFVDIGEALKDIRQQRSKSVPSPDLVRHYGLSTPHARTLRRKQSFEAPNQTTLRLFAAHNAAKRNRSSWKERLSKVKPMLPSLGCRKDSMASFRSIMSSFNKKQAQKVDGQCSNIGRSSTSVYLPVGAEFDVYGRSEEGDPTLATVIEHPEQGEVEENLSSLTSGEVTIWRHAANTESPVSNETAPTSASSPVSSSSWTSDEWSVLLGTEADDDGYADIVEWSKNVRPAEPRMKRTSSIANISDDSRTPSFSLDWDRDHCKLFGSAPGLRIRMP